MRVDENVPAVKPQPRRDVPAQPAVDMSPEREEQMFRDFEASKKQTLAESIQGYYNQSTHQQYQQPNQAPMLNEEHLMGAVKGTVDKYLTENFGLVVEEAIKSTILEMYAIERIKEVLNENRDLVKSLVYETIREIQEKNKMKKNNN
jgi:flagellar biosynthesis/type III secretory pathway protein FliH